ncbi:hypothetical protein LSH36_311g00028 [Paralvinella palmiformis]|uniref:G-protein coupled receptors family 1 profile domain-containing protein n=1 Tax=Paralvinella palmiformis TaxID=53620 RepID=A0AAD9JH16_9ANNE|nr:hypothetical protein LSH36_311g00028 [Paralvinella palmiformis]
MKLSSCEGCEDCARGLYAYPYISKIDTIRNIAAPANETGNNTNNTTTINVLDPNISKLTYNIWLHGGIFLIVLGTIGNSLSMTFRLFAVFNPHRVRNIFTNKSAIIQITATGVFLVIVNLHFFWTQDLKKGVCDAIERRYMYFSRVWNWIDFVICSFAPFAIMLSSNVAIITRLVYLQKTKKQSSTNKRNNTMTLTLIIVTFVFFLSTGPLTLFINVGEYWIERAKTNEDFEIIDVSWASFNILAYSNNAVNFILYCLSGPNFRKELAEMLHLEKCWKKIGPELSGNTATMATVQNSV